MDRTYSVVLLKEHVGGYSAVVPALPGCFSQGANVPEALDMAREAIQCHIKSLEAHGDPVPSDVEKVAFDWGAAEEAFAYKVAVREAVPVA